MKSKKKVLLVTQSLSYGATGGGNQSANFAQMLAQMPSVALDIAVFGPEQMLLPQMDSATVLDFRCPCHRWRTLWRSLQVQPAFVSGRMYRRLKAQIRNGQYDLVVADISLFGRLIRYVKKHRLAPTMAYYQNVEYDFSRDQARVGGLKYHFLHWCVARNEALCSRYVDYTVLVNDEEEARLQQLYGRKMDCHLPVFMHRPQRTVAPSESPDGLRMLFVGSDFYANVHGIKWFVEQVLPHVDARLTVVGRGLDRVLASYDSPRLHCLGFVPDLAEVYASHQLVVAPIFVGAGMKVKIAEALGYGKAVAATPFALSGYPGGEPEALHACATAQEFIGYIANFPKNKYICDASDALFDRLYAFETVVGQFGAFLERILHDRQ